MDSVSSRRYPSLNRLAKEIQNTEWFCNSSYVEGLEPSSPKHWLVYPTYTDALQATRASPRDDSANPDAGELLREVEEGLKEADSEGKGHVFEGSLRDYAGARAHFLANSAKVLVRDSIKCLGLFSYNVHSSALADLSALSVYRDVSLFVECLVFRDALPEHLICHAQDRWLVWHSGYGLFNDEAGKFIVYERLF